MQYDQNFIFQNEVLGWRGDGWDKMDRCGGEGAQWIGLGRTFAPRIVLCGVKGTLSGHHICESGKAMHYSWLELLAHSRRQ